MAKIALLGSNGYVGKNIYSLMGYKHDIRRFSHSSSNVYLSEKYESGTVYSSNSIVGAADDFDFIIFLLNASTPSDQNRVESLFRDICETGKSSKIVLLSTLSLNSIFDSSYVSTKRRLEVIAAGYDNILVLRPGVIYGGIPGGLYKSFLGFKKSNFIYLPFKDAKTGFLHIENLVNEIEMFISTKINSCNPNPLYQMNLTLADAIRYFGFRGVKFGFSKGLMGGILKITSPHVKKLPLTLQSLVVLAGLDLPSNNNSYPVKSRHFEKILLADLIDFNRGIPIHMNLRKFIREIASNNSYELYKTLESNQLLIFHKRLYEIYMLDRHQKKLESSPLFEGSDAHVV